MRTTVKYAGCFSTRGKVVACVLTVRTHKNEQIGRSVARLERNLEAQVEKMMQAATLGCVMRKFVGVGNPTTTNKPSFHLISSDFR